MESQVLHHRHADHDVSDQAGTSATVTRDPVCGMTVDPHAGKPTAEHAGRVFHFCGASCREKFLKQPERYYPKLELKPKGG